MNVDDWESDTIPRSTKKRRILKTGAESIKKQASLAKNVYPLRIVQISKFLPYRHMVWAEKETQKFFDDLETQMDHAIPTSFT